MMRRRRRRGGRGGNRHIHERMMDRGKDRMREGRTERRKEGNEGKKGKEGEEGVNTHTNTWMNRSTHVRREKPRIK